MPISRSGTYFYLVYGEKVRFRIQDVGILKSEKGQMTRQLAIPHKVHISTTPFRGSNRKTVACGGEGRCEICQGGHTPSTLYRVKIQLIGDEHGEQAGTVKIYDMPTSAHKAVASAIQDLIDENMAEDDILDTIFELERLDRRKPYFICRVHEKPAIIAEDESDLELTEADTALLNKLSAALVKKKGSYSDPAKAMRNTLRKYGWSDAKIEVAFSTALVGTVFTEDGQLM